MILTGMVLYVCGSICDEEEHTSDSDFAMNRRTALATLFAIAIASSSSQFATWSSLVAKAKKQQTVKKEASSHAVWYWLLLAYPRLGKRHAPLHHLAQIRNLLTAWDHQSRKHHVDRVCHARGAAVYVHRLKPHHGPGQHAAAALNNQGS